MPTLFGTKSGGFSGGAGSNTVLLTGFNTPGGTPADPPVGALLIMAIVTAGNNTVNIATPGEWSDLGLATGNDTNKASLQVFYRIHDGDSGVSVQASGQTAYAQAYSVVAITSFDTADPFGDLQTATGTNSARPNPPAITSTQNNSLAVVIGAGAGSSATVYVEGGDLDPTADGFTTAAQNDTYPAIIGLGVKTLGSSGTTFNAVAWTGGSNNAADSWASLVVEVLSSLITGTGTITLDELTTVSGTGKLKIAASSTAVLAALTMSSAGVVKIAGSSSVVLDELQTTASATLDIAASSTIALDPLQTAATGMVEDDGNVAFLSLDPLILTASGESDILAAATVTFDALTLTSAAIAAQTTGSASLQLAALTMESAGVLPLRGSSGLELGALELVARGSFVARTATPPTRRGTPFPSRLSDRRGIAYP